MRTRAPWPAVRERADDLQAKDLVADIQYRYRTTRCDSSLVVLREVGYRNRTAAQYRKFLLFVAIVYETWQLIKDLLNHTMTNKVSGTFFFFLILQYFSALYVSM